MLKVVKLRHYLNTGQRRSLDQSFDSIRWFWNCNFNLMLKTYKNTEKELSDYRIKKLIFQLKGETIKLDLGLTYLGIAKSGALLACCFSDFFAIAKRVSRYSKPRFLIKNKTDLKQKQKRLSKKQKGLNKNNQNRKKVTTIRPQIINYRRDFLHKLSLSLVQQNQIASMKTYKSSVISIRPHHHF